ncbi:hypothetical protein DIE22_16165 [Burkholderia sp. Bp9142]|nr:hypothetical protein DIE22_16165 [Burkholderia sp. Bp9142]
MIYTTPEKEQETCRDDEGAHFGYVDTGPHLQISMTAPTRDEVRAFRKGRARFVLVEEWPILFFLAKFGDMPWWDAPYSLSILPQELRRMNEEYRPGLRYSLTSVLIDSLSGGQRGVRVCTLSPEFSNALHGALERQRGSTVDRESYDRVIDQAYRRFPSTESMLPSAVCKCDGGS